MKDEILNMLTAGKWNPLYDLARCCIDRFKESGHLTLLVDNVAVLSGIPVERTSKSAFYRSLSNMKGYQSLVMQIFDHPDSVVLHWESGPHVMNIPIRFCALTTRFVQHAEGASVGENVQVQIGLPDCWDSGVATYECVGVEDVSCIMIRPFIGFVWSPDNTEIWGPKVSNLHGFKYQKTINTVGDGGDFIIMDADDRAEIVSQVVEPSGENRIHSGIYFSHNGMAKEFTICQSFEVNGVKPNAQTVAGLIAFDGYNGRINAGKPVSEWVKPLIDACLDVSNSVAVADPNGIVFELDDDGMNPQLNMLIENVKKQSDKDSLFSKLYCLEYYTDPTTRVSQLMIWKDGRPYDIYTDDPNVMNTNQSCAVHAAAAALYINNRKLVANMSKVFGLYYLYYALVYSDGMLLWDDNNGDPITYPAGNKDIRCVDFFANDFDDETSLYFNLLRKKVEPGDDLYSNTAYVYKVPGKQHYVVGYPRGEGVIEVVYDSLFNIGLNTIQTGYSSPAGKYYANAAVFDGDTMTVERFGVLAKGQYNIQSSLNKGGSLA